MTTRLLIMGGLDGMAQALGDALAKAGAVVQFAGAADADVSFAFTPLDLDDPFQLGPQVDALEDFDTAVFLPGWRAFGPFIETTPADWDAALDRNFSRMTWAAQAVARRLVRAGRGGRLIFVTSVLATMPFGGAVTLGTSLAALHAIARVAAVELGQYGITSNVVAPGWLADEEFAAYPGPTREHITAGIPLGHSASAGELAAVVAFLASEAGRYLTGVILPADGGYTLTPSTGRSLLDAD